jgi:small redox-active disulfide protein 2
MKGDYMTIKILGTGCPKCVMLEKHTRIALNELNQSIEIIKVSSLKDISSYGVLSTPAFVLNEKVLAYGKVLSSRDIIQLITPYLT